MKRLLPLVCFTLLTVAASAQFFKQVNYRGAFAPAPEAMWTDGWVNWNPQTTPYAATNQTLSGHITTNTTLTKDKTYLLSGVVYVDAGVTLTIEAGTVIRGNAAVLNSCLIIKRGAKINAQGTAANPIVFTSSKAVNDRAKGNWGGIILLGKARNNNPGGVGYVEGLPAGDDVIYGGTDDADNSGIMKYVRIEFPGYIFDVNKEINGLTFGSVGSGTTIDYIQVSNSNDDSYEWFGGSVNCSHLVAYQGLDDDFDTDLGFSGKVQFGIAIRDPDVADAPSVSTSEGFESDNDAGGSPATPKTSAIFSNITVVGPYRGDPTATVDAGFRRGARLRRNTELKIFNSIFMDHATGLFIDGADAFANANNGLLKYRHNLVVQPGGAPTFRVAEDANSRTVFFNAAYKNDSVQATSGILVKPYDFLAPDYRPATGSPALTNYDFTDASFGTLYQEGAIKSVNYRGAFAPAPEPMWTDGWVNWNPQTTPYAATNQTLSGHITTNTTLTKDKTYLLSGVVYVDAGVTLTIEAGTVIRGNAAVLNSCLIIKRGAKINAQGTAANPIVFTSSKAVNDRAKGNWGGIILLGKARNNNPGGVGYVEGLPAGDDVIYGGTDDADNSGIMKYVRIEFPGYIFDVNKEINGLTFGSVGSGTTIDYIQVSNSNDDSYEWFGGSVNCSHLVAYQGLDDDFDTDLGFSGKVQFGIAIRDPDVADAPSVSTSEGFESDNDAGGSLATPKTSATFSNITIIGPYRGDPTATVDAGFRRGARLRRNTELKIFNSIFMDHATGLFIDGADAFANANNSLLKYRHNLVVQPGGAPTFRVAEDANSRTVFFNAAYKNDSVQATSGILVKPYDFSAPDYRPAPGSPALSNYDFNDVSLPVTFTTFTGSSVKGDNLLTWRTATEINNKGFEVERSTNGTEYSSLGFVATKAINGNSNTAISYDYIDAKAAATNTFYYRLKQVDKDGRFSYSRIVVLVKQDAEGVLKASVYPNPAASQLNVTVTSSEAKIVTVVLNDMFGRAVVRKVFAISQGDNNLGVNISSLAKGNYFVSVIDADGKAQNAVKVVKN